MFNLLLKGADTASAQLDVACDAVTPALLAKAQALAERLRRHVADDKLSGQVLQVRSGALKASIAADVGVDGDVVRTRVFSAGDLKYALIQEYGGRTAAHDIVPNKAKALAFMMGGRQVFARIVHHPGSTIPAHAYLRGGLDDLASSIAAELKAAAIEALKP